MSKLTEIQQDDVFFEIYYFTGQVVSEKKWSETEVSGGGGGGGGYVRGSSGYSSSSSVHISSKTTRHDQIILQNSEGKEKSFQFSDINLACREGNTLSVVWAIKKGEESGPYLFVYNHNSEEISKVGSVKSLFTPITNLWVIGIGAMVASGIPYVGIIALPVLLYIPYFLFKRKRFIESIGRSKSYNEIPKLLNAALERTSNKSIQQTANASAD